MRAAVSARVTITAPLIAEHGSRYSWSEPTMRRMMCGTISPTKPSIPATLTADAVSKAERMISRVRIRTTRIPRFLQLLRLAAGH